MKQKLIELLSHYISEEDKLDIIVNQILELTGQPILNATELEELQTAKQCWNNGKKVEAVTTVKYILGLDLANAKTYCERHFK